jgi:enoyl-CoA hydratase/carnithine racemase
MEPLCTLQIPPIENHPGGTITLTLPAPQTYLLTIASPPDNRLTTPVCETLQKALTKVLAIAQQQSTPGVVLLTSNVAKFFSNGLDLNHVTSQITAEKFFPNVLYPLFKSLLTFPLPTIAVINGHAFAGGLMLSMMCDYRIMNPSKGFLCLNEIHFGALLKAPMTSIFREKTSAQTYRALVLEGNRFTGPEAVRAGIVDSLGGLEEALTLVRDRKLMEVGKSGVFGMMRAEMYRETVGFLSGESFVVEERNEKGLMEEDDRKRREAGEVGKAKL